ncbi:hypothetical protein CDL15_Pgr004639 [Punica granatum]|nr:hypothetical protein CDL15_Pgr004639 [Punica granatum]
MHIVCLTSNFLVLTTSNAFPGSVAPLCHKDDMSALLQFKNSFTNAPSNPHAPSIPFPRPKVESWTDPNNQTSSNCCSWDGVACDDKAGHVIALDLSSSNLFGSINSSSSLFRLVHLQRLNLAFNHFNHSRIPSGFGLLSGLTHLNLSHSFFSGQVPPDIFTLTRMISLDLSGDLLELRSPGLATLAQNLTNLQFLNLDGVDILSPVPDTLASLSSLRSLSLSRCGVHGVFPESILQLPNLENLILNYNINLTVHFPDFNAISPLRMLGLLDTRLSGELPSSIGNLESLEGLELDPDNCNLTGALPYSVGNLRSLKYLIIRGCGFSGSIPSSLASLTQLTYLDLSSNAFSLQNLSSLSWLWKLTKLGALYLRGTSLQGEIPSSVGNLSRLGVLDLGDNRLSGLVPAELLNLRQMKRLLLDNNELSGYIPSWLSNMTQLTFINLQFNRLQGPVPLWITQLPNLTSLHLCFNQMNGIEDSDLSNHSLTGSSVTLPKLSSLGLASCNLREFPILLQNHPNLELLDLNSNNIRGQVPLWMENIGISSLHSLNLSHNFLTGFDPSLKILPWMNLQTFDITSNMFTGPPPTPPPSANLDTYLAKQNKLSGPFPRWICNLSSLVTLDLSFNNLRGTLPDCLGNVSTSLSVLNLQRNRFSGNIPQLYASGMQLKMIALGHNQLQGQLPRSLANCSMMEFIDMGNNQISDIFPSWLESLPHLKVLILSQNKFHGVIGTPGSLSGFQRLRIINLSYNLFTGMLPEGYFQTWTSMKAIDSLESQKLTYLEARCHFGFYQFYMIMINKGIHTYYPKVLETFTAIDLSENMFSGDIPNAIGDLRQLHLLNLSNNFLTGGIPSTIGHLSELESLDLSGNRLSGQIPEELAELNFLSSLNVSHNNLTGSIPRGPQFNTFTKSSFEGNPGLCGDTISKKCSSPDVEDSPAAVQDDSSWFWEFDWKVVLLGYGSGLAIGFVIENAFNSGKQPELAEAIRRRLQNRQRKSRRISRN